MKQHVIVVAWLQIGLSIVWVVIGFGIAALILGAGVASHDRDVTEILGIVAPIIVTFSILTAIPSIIGGIFLLRFKEWARILVIIISFIDLINFPIGTALGIYSLWVLLKTETVKLFIPQPPGTTAVS